MRVQDPAARAEVMSWLMFQMVRVICKSCTAAGMHAKLFSLPVWQCVCSLINIVKALAIMGKILMMHNNFAQVSLI